MKSSIWFLASLLDSTSFSSMEVVCVSTSDPVLKSKSIHFFVAVVGNLVKSLRKLADRHSCNVRSSQ